MKYEIIVTDGNNEEKMWGYDKVDTLAQISQLMEQFPSYTIAIRTM